MSKGLYTLIEKFLCVYLPKHRGYSSHTIVSYHASLSSFLTWMVKTLGCKKEKIQVFDFKTERILLWLDEIENDGNSASTRNQRLAGIRSFLAFAAEEDIVYTETHINARKIKVKKGKRPPKDFLSQEELQEILKAISGGSDLFLGHYVLLVTLYDSGLRVQEICELKLDDISFGKNCTIKVFGKGQKTRIVYLSSDTASVIQSYCKRIQRTEGFLFHNRYGNSLTDSGIDYIIKKYVSIASEKLPSLKPKKVSAHTFRRSKATHMLQNGVSLPVIQRFLGHESIQTTEVYLEIGSEAIIKAVNESATSLMTPDTINEPEKWRDLDIMERIRKKIS